MLTARHCVTDNAQINGTVDTDIAHYFMAMGNQWRFSNRVLAISGSGNDAAILVVSGSFVINNGQTTGNANHKFSIASDPSSSLQGLNLPCYGYGGDGMTLTGGLVFMDFHQLGIVFTNPGPDGATFQHGDSGGPCMVFQQNTWKVAGVISLLNVLTGADTFRSWANQQVCAFSTVPGACTP